MKSNQAYGFNNFKGSTWTEPVAFIYKSTVYEIEAILCVKSVLYILAFTIVCIYLQPQCQI